MFHTKGSVQPLDMNNYQVLDDIPLISVLRDSLNIY